MAGIVANLYFQRHNLDGTDDAICLNCFRTVPCGKDETGTTKHECDTGALLDRLAFARP
jgi:hypothetical protein